MENNNEDGSQAGTKIILLLSLLLLFLDLFEFISTFHNIIHYHEIYPIEVFNECIKYQSIGQAFFAMFGAFAALSACLLSFNLIMSFDYFVTKMLETFLYYNYTIFGTFLLGTSLLGGYYFNQFAYVCDSQQNKHLHITMTISLLFSLIASVSITIIYSMVITTSLLYNSIRFERNGNLLIGKLFWHFIQNRVRRSFNNEVRENNNNNNNHNGLNNNNNVIQRNREGIDEELPNIIGE